MSRFVIIQVLAGICLALVISANSAPTPSPPSTPPSSPQNDQVALSSILPKLQAIHEDTKTLLIKNRELKSKILVGLQAQNEAKLKQVKEMKSIGGGQVANVGQQPATTLGSMPPVHQQQDGPKSQAIDYAELEDFNRWVEHNLEYAVKNTQATAETLKEEAAHNNGNVDYSDQAIKDGIEGVKYWQSAVIFQDKTLKNEKFDIDMKFDVN